MKNLSVIAITIALACVSANAAPATRCDELWGQACFGMTVDEVLNSVPQTTKKEAGEKLGDGAQELVEGQLQPISNHTFRPEFYFLNGHLEQVTLHLEGETNFTAARLTFENLIPALRSKYGQEISIKEPRPGLLYMRSMSWMHNGTNISMLIVAVGETDPLINIVYQRRVTNDASHL